jgi:hypothetical protein
MYQIVMPQESHILTGNNPRVLISILGEDLGDRKIKRPFPLPAAPVGARAWGRLARRPGTRLALPAAPHASGWPALVAAGRPLARAAGHGEDRGRVTGLQGAEWRA